MFISSPAKDLLNCRVHALSALDQILRPREEEKVRAARAYGACRVRIGFLELSGLIPVSRCRV